jgi:DNA-binding response OmpR family regulator
MGGRILLVDDEPYIVRILSFKLRREGFTTFEAATAEEAEAILAREDIDLVLLDVALASATSGFDLAERLRSRAATRAIPILMLTARNSPSDVARGNEVGACGYITKPFSTTTLVERVRSLLGE